MPIYDISLGISPQMVVWPGDPPVILERVAAIAEGANANVSRLSASVHSGTHVDAPSHFYQNAPAVESLPLSVLTGEAWVIAVPQASVIDAEVLEAAQIPKGAERLLFKTRNSDLWAAGEADFHTDFVAVDASGARWLAERQVRLVGIDYLSISPWKQSRPVHRLLIDAGMLIVEGLDLSAVPPGRYMLYCLPLKLLGSDGAPARAILVTA